MIFLKSALLGFLIILLIAFMVYLLGAENK